VFLPSYRRFSCTIESERRRKVTKARLDGFFLLLAGCLLFLLAGVIMDHMGSGFMVDFKGVYYGAQCLLQHTDPYHGDSLRLYLRDTGVPLQPSDAFQQNLSWPINLPNALAFVAPFAALPWPAAHLLWMVITAAVFLLAAFLAWDLAADYAPVLSGALVALCAVDSFGLLAGGNIAGIVVSFCVIAVWCFFRQRFVPAGVLCLAVALALKPHDAGLLWLFFLLAGGLYRKHALQALVLTVALSIPSVLWVAQIAPHWMQEIHANLLASSAHGAVNDPGIDAVTVRSASMIISLQSALSVFHNDPRFYNLAAYLICAPLLLAWAARSLRVPASPEKHWIALAAIVPLTLLVTYHRSYDARLLLLAVPACAMLWAEGGRIAKLALLACVSAFAFTGDLSLTLFLWLTNGVPRGTSSFAAKSLTVASSRPTPLILLAVALIYLWLYLRRLSPPAEPAR
jgi:hypothetical protein